MAACAENSRVAIPFLPTLLHLSTVKISISLLKDFDELTLTFAIYRIKNGNHLTPYKNCKCSWVMEVNRAHKRLLFIPAHLRLTVLEAVCSMQYEEKKWRDHHSGIPEVKDGSYISYWKSDGRFHDRKIVQQLVLNKNIEIRNRYALACKYWLEESIWNLSIEMSRISGISSELAAGKIFDETFECQLRSWFTCCFPLLEPDVKKDFIFDVKYLDGNNFILCLYALTEEQQHQVLKQCPLKLLMAYLEWPWQSLFLDAADKMWNYLTEIDFITLLKHISNKAQQKYYDYNRLFVDFLNRSPIRFRKNIVRFSRSHIKTKMLTY